MRHRIPASELHTITNKTFKQTDDVLIEIDVDRLENDTYYKLERWILQRVKPSLAFSHTQRGKRSFPTWARSSLEKTSALQVHAFSFIGDFRPTFRFLSQRGEQSERTDKDWYGVAL